MLVMTPTSWDDVGRPADPRLSYDPLLIRSGPLFEGVRRVEDVTFSDKWRSFCGAKWRPAGSGVLATAYKGCSGQSEITCDLSCGLAAFDQADSASNLAVSDPAGLPPRSFPASRRLSMESVTRSRLNVVFHLRESGHDREQHGPHGCRSVDIASTEV
jgi:hypothetical protein